MMQCMASQGTRRYGSEEAEPIDWIVSPSTSASPGFMTSPGLSEMFAYHAVTMANTIKTSLIVFSRKVSSVPLSLNTLLFLLNVELVMLDKQLPLRSF